MKYNAKLARAIMYDKIKVAKAVNAKLISLEDAPKGYKDFDKGTSVKYVIDPHHVCSKHLGCNHHHF